jgi:hypothetical protein
VPSLHLPFPRPRRQKERQKKHTVNQDGNYNINGNLSI